MPTKIDSDLFKKTIEALAEETFSDVKGIYLDGKTSLMESLAVISSEEASRPITDEGTSIAGQAEHIRFYLRVLNSYMDGTLTEKIDWSKSWQVKTVTESEWTTLKKLLEDDYNDLRSKLAEITDWNDEKRLGGALAIITHTAYHLGAIRQIMRIVKK